MKDIRCPECGLLVCKSSELNVNPIEVKCRKCKTLVLFQGSRIRVLDKPFDKARAFG